jgi:hypothetical protein
LVFFGSLSAKLALPMSNELTTGLQIDNSFESISYICYYYNIIDEMIALGSKGWYSGITFYEFYRKGGLHSVLEFYQKLLVLLPKIDDNSILRSMILVIEMTVKKLVAFIVRFVLEDDKNVRDSRQSELFLQTIYTYKMNETFDSSKHFFQNVCHTLLQKVLPYGDSNPLQIKSKVCKMKL